MFMIPSPVFMRESLSEYTPFNPPAWSLFFEFLANFIYAAFIRSLSDKVVSALMILGAFVVVAQAYCLNGVAGGNHLNDILFGLGRVFFHSSVEYSYFAAGLFARMPVAKGSTSRRA
jgi:peptidoglycan/LPS O-acetylase OafA/YrhL